MNYRYRSIPDAEYYTISLPEERDCRGVEVCGFRKSGLGLKATLVEMSANDEIARKAVINAAASWARRRGARYWLRNRQIMTLMSGCSGVGLFHFAARRSLAAR